MKSRQFSSNPNMLYTNQDTQLPIDSSFVKRKFLDIPYATLSLSQKLDSYHPHVGDWSFPVIAGINSGAFFGWDKVDMHVAHLPNSIIEDAFHPDPTLESNENIDNRSIH